MEKPPGGSASPRRSGDGIRWPSLFARLSAVSEGPYADEATDVQAGPGALLLVTSGEKEALRSLRPEGKREARKKLPGPASGLALHISVKTVDSTER